MSLSLRDLGVIELLDQLAEAQSDQETALFLRRLALLLPRVTDPRLVRSLSDVEKTILARGIALINLVVPHLEAIGVAAAGDSERRGNAGVHLVSEVLVAGYVAPWFVKQALDIASGTDAGPTARVRRC